MIQSSFSLKTATAILGLLLLQTSLFAWSVKPISGIGIVVKKKPNSSAEKKAITDDAGNFEIKLTRGSYQLILPEQQILSAINAVNETGKTIASNDKGLDAVTCTLMETEGIKIWKSEALDGNVSATIEVTVAEATITGTMTYDVKTNKAGRNVGHPSIIKITDGKATQLVAAPAGTNGMDASDMPINEQGLPENKDGKQKTKSNNTNESIAIDTNEDLSGTTNRALKTRTKSNQTNERMAIDTAGTKGSKKEKKHSSDHSAGQGQQDKQESASDPFPPKQNQVEKQKRENGKTYVGHVTLNRRTINPESGSQPNMETFTPTNKLPGKNQKIIFYEINTINIPGYGNTQPSNMAVVYQFYTANGKTYAVPSLLFDLPNPPSDIQFPVADFRSSASRMVKPTSSGSEISFNPSTQQCDLSYQTMVGGKTAMVQMSLTEIATTMSNNPTQSSYWCGISTNCGEVFAVLVTNGTPCGNVNSFFNKACDGLKANQE